MNTIFDIQRPENLPAEYADLTISDCILLAISKNKLKPAEKKLVNDYKKIVAKEEKTKAAALAKEEKANAKAEAVARAKAEKAEAIAQAKAEKAEAIAQAKAEKAEAIALAKAEKAIKAKETRAAKAKAARAAKAVAAAANTEENAVNAIVKEKRARIKKPANTPIVEAETEPIVDTPIDEDKTVNAEVYTPLSLVNEMLASTEILAFTEDGQKLFDHAVGEPNVEHLVEEVYIEKEKPNAKAKVVKKPAAEKKPKNKKTTDA
jgi:hypothetical protein